MRIFVLAGLISVGCCLGGEMLSPFGELPKVGKDWMLREKGKIDGASGSWVIFTNAVNGDFLSYAAWGLTPGNKRELITFTDTAHEIFPAGLPVWSSETKPSVINVPMRHGVRKQNFSQEVLEVSFVQEEDRGTNRLAHGYVTICDDVVVFVQHTSIRVITPEFAHDRARELLRSRNPAESRPPQSRATQVDEIDQLIEKWKSGAQAERAEADEAVKAMGSEAATVMARWIKSADKRIANLRSRQVIAHFFSVLGDAGSPSVPILIDALRENSLESPQDRDRLLFTLGQLSNIGPSASSAIDEIILRMEGRQFALSEAITALWAISDGNASDRRAMSAYLSEPDRLRRIVAAGGLGLSFDPTEAISGVILSALRGEDRAITQHLLVCLPKFKGSKELYFPALTNLFTSSVNPTPDLAAKALGAMGAEVLPFIEQSLKSENKQMRKMGAKALSIYASYHQRDAWVKINHLIIPLGEDPEPEVAIYAVHILSQFPEKLASPELNTLIRRLAESENTRLANQASRLLVIE